MAIVHPSLSWRLLMVIIDFMKYEGNRPIRVLFPEQLESSSPTGNGFSQRRRIEDNLKRKGDAISKGLVILQTSACFTWPLLKPLYIVVPQVIDKYEKRAGTFYPDKWADASGGCSVVLVLGIHRIGWSFLWYHDFRINVMACRT